MNVSLIHKTCEFYKKIYLVSAIIPKRDRFGLFAKIENICLETIMLTITAALEAKKEKIAILRSARIKIEVSKRLVRIANELSIIRIKNYIDFQTDLQEISKMVNGWIKYITKKEF